MMSMNDSVDILTGHSRSVIVTYKEITGSILLGAAYSLFLVCMF